MDDQRKGHSRRETEGERARRSLSLIFVGAPVPEGLRLPALAEPPGESDPKSLERAARDIEALKGTHFHRWTSQPLGALGVMAEPGGVATWGQLTEAGRLVTVQNWVDYDGVSARDRLALIRQAVDYDKLPCHLKDELDQGLTYTTPEQPKASCRTDGRKGRPIENDPGNDI